jgi:hypothetical protein
MAYMSLTVLAQSVVHVAIVATTEELVMKKAKDLLRLFVFSVIDVILTVLLNAISSGHLSHLSLSLVKGHLHSCKRKPGAFQLSSTQTPWAEIVFYR